MMKYRILMSVRIFRILVLGKIADLFSELGYITKGSIASRIFKQVSRFCIHNGAVYSIELINRMEECTEEDCRKKQWLISQYQRIIERNARS